MICFHGPFSNGRPLYIPGPSRVFGRWRTITAVIRIAATFFFLVLTVLAQRKPITIDTVMQHGFAHGDGGPPVWAPDGKQFAFRKGNSIMLYDIPAKSEKELLSLDSLEKAAV